MTSAELKTFRESLGLTVGWLAAQANVRERTVRYWESGRTRVPDDVTAIIKDAEDKAQLAVDAVMEYATLKTERRPGESIDLRRFRDDAELWRWHPTMEPLPATWHAAALARAARALGERGIGATIRYMDEPL